MEVVASADRALGSSGAFLINILDPEALIGGGGPGVAGGLYWDRFTASTRRRIWAEQTKKLPIRRVELGSDSGLIGAAAAALRSSGSQQPRRFQNSVSN